MQPETKTKSANMGEENEALQRMLYERDFNQALELRQFEEWMQKNVEQLVDPALLQLAIDQLRNLRMQQRESTDSVTIAPLIGQEKPTAGQKADLTKMWVLLKDEFKNLTFGMARLLDNNFFKILHVIVKRGTAQWDQPLSLTNTVRLEVFTDAAHPETSKNHLDTGGFVFVPYYVNDEDAQIYMCVNAEKTVVGSGLSVPGASVGNLNELKETGIEKMFGGKLKDLMAIEQSVGKDDVKVDAFLMNHQIVGPLSTDDDNRGTQTAVYIPIELKGAQISEWQEKQQGVFVPISDLNRLRTTKLLVGHTKNALDVLMAVEGRSLIAVSQLVQAALVW